MSGQSSYRFKQNTSIPAGAGASPPAAGAPPRILVIGAGVIGVTTALALQAHPALQLGVVPSEASAPGSSLPAVAFHPRLAGPVSPQQPAPQRSVSAPHVEIWAADFPPHTTSNVAGAYWFPFNIHPAHRVEHWAERTKQEMERWVATLGSETIGVRPSVMAHVEPHGQVSLAAHKSAADERPDVQIPAGHDMVDGGKTLLIDPDICLGYLFARFLEQGGVTKRKFVNDLSEALCPSLGFDAVINCTGLGSRELVGDARVYPARGQIIVVKGVQACPTVYSVRTGPLSLGYIIPRMHDTVLGGTYEEHDECMRVRSETTDAILARTRGLSCGRLTAEGSKKVEILRERVGLRPCRDEVRLEPEWFQLDLSTGKVFTHGTAASGATPDSARYASRQPNPGHGVPSQQVSRLVVHNYGHGGGGWTVAIGCAEEAAHHAVVQLAQYRDALAAVSARAHL